ncbi:MAG: polyphosphate kinase, partial [Paracoccaceae bacterium]
MTSTPHPADFLASGFGAPVTLPETDLSGPQRFFNRELSWLAFNWRVLDEARNPKVPLLERVRFVSISATNLDEFYTVRVAGLRELVREGISTPAADGSTPAQQLVLIDTEARRLLHAQQDVWNDLLEALGEENIQIMGATELNKDDLAYLAEYFMAQVFPVVSPLAIDPAHPFPFIANTGFCLALQLESKTGPKRALQALLPIPAQVPRFVPLPAPEGTHRFLPMEALLLTNLGSLFPGYTARGHCTFRVLRDSDLEIEEEAEDLVREFETAIKR